MLKSRRRQVMSKNYDLIATVDIDLESPIVDDSSFDNILIMGPAPASGADVPDVGVYSSINEVKEAGFVVSGDDADPVGEAAMVAFSQSPTPTSVYIAVQRRVASASSAESAIQSADSDDETDTESETPADIPENELEEPSATIARAVATSGWYVLCTAGVPSSSYEEIAAYVETQEKMFVYTELDFFNKGEASVGSVYYRTKGIYGRETSEQADADIPAANLYMNVASAVKWLNYESGDDTFAFKPLASVYPSSLTSSEIKALTDANLDYFTTVGSKNITMNGKVRAGEWADVIRFRDWLKNDMQVRVVNLFVTNSKIPYTDAGIALVQNQMLASLKAGLDAGGIADDEYDEDGNLIPGYTTSVPLASSLSAAERASRKLTNCKFKARLSGAIHFAELTGSLTYSL
jgi:hypothetical protein